MMTPTSPAIMICLASSEFLAKNAYYPFALYPNGILDYGSEYEPQERYANFDLGDGRIELRRLLTIESRAIGIQRFRIVEIRPLG